MARHQKFRINSVDDLRSQVEALRLSIPADEDISILSEPITIAGKKVANRLAVHPMEGFDAEADGSPDELSFRRYRRYAEGGFGLIWMEATAVLPEARTNPGQFYLHEGSADCFARLVDATRKAAKASFGRDIVLILQLTHSGRYSKVGREPRPIIAHHCPALDAQHDLPLEYPVVTDDYLDRVQDAFAAAARLAAKCGLDGVDVKSCHRYLVSELLASFTREGRYGGSFENRTRLLREAIARIRREVPGVFVTTRFNAFDAIAYPYGFGMNPDGQIKQDLSEPIELVRKLGELGVPVLNHSVGNPYFNPYFGRPFDTPVIGAKVPDEHPLEGIDRFLGITRRLQESFPDIPLIGSGYSWLRQFMPNVGAAVIRTGGASFLGVGRAAFAYPDMPKDLFEKGQLDPAKCCIACSACTQLMRDGAHTGCVVRDASIYGPIYKAARKATKGTTK